MTAPATMTAACFDRYGPPERLLLRQIPIPAPGAGDIRVRIRFSTVTRTDTATLRGHPFFARLMTGVLRPRMAVLGIDFAGEVDAIGAGVTRFAVGDEVFGLLPDRFGGHAQYVCISETAAVTLVPTGIALEAAVIGEGAWYASSSTDDVQPGHACLVYGASGAIGTAAVQLAKAQGAHVTAVVGARHMDLAHNLGADAVINFEAQDFTALPGRFDLVMDAVGHTSWFACRHLIAPNGRYTATDLGPYWSNIWLSVLSRRVGVPYPSDAPGFVHRLATLISVRDMRGVFDRTYPLSDIEEAFRYVETGQKTGIVRLKMP